MKLLLLAWSGADWRLLQPMVDAGQLPALGALIDSGVIGNLMTLPPPDQAARWSTLATGRSADVHGILHRVLPLPDDAGIRPATSRDLRAPTLWQRAAAAGRKAAVVGWPASHPAEGGDALVVSDAFAEARGADFAHWPLPPGAVSDADLAETLAELRLHPTEVTPEQVLPFVPAGARIDQETDERLPLLVATLARAASIHNAATWIAEHRDWDLLAVHFDLVERLSSAFLQYSPPRLPHVTETDFALFSEVVDGAYRFMDLLLARYLQLIDPETRVLLVSDHGFLTGQLRPGAAPASRGERISRLHRPFGVLLAQGPGIRRDDLVFGATLLDVAPTALAMLGLAPPAELEGKVLAEVFTEAPVLHPAECAPAHAGDDAPGADLDRRWGAARILELVALGYLAQPPSDPATAAGAARIQGLLNLARVQMGRRDWAAALESLAALLALAPDHLEGRFAVAQCRLQMGDTGRCREVLDDIAESGAGGPSLAFLYGQLCIKEGDRAAAADHLRRAEEGGIPGRLLLERIGRAHLSAQNWTDAERSLRNALAIDPDFALAHNGLGHALAALGRHHEAIEHLRLAIGILRMQPDAHYRLGLSLAALGRPLEAAQALRNALSMEPNLPGAQAAMGRVQRQLARAAIADANDEGQRST